MPCKVRFLRNHCTPCAAVATNRQPADPQMTGRPLTASVALGRVADGTRLVWNRCHSGLVVG